MSLHLETQIKNARLTKVEQLIANYFLEHMESLYFFSAKDIALELHVSDTSVIRLCRTLGYSGFRELQLQLQKDLTAQLAQEKYVLPHQQVQKKSETLNEMDHPQHLAMALQNLQSTYSKNDPLKIRQTVEILLQSDHIFVGGFRGSSAAACYLGVLLSQYVGHVEYAVYADSSCMQEILDYGKNDCVILIGMERYSKMACVLADMARANHCHLITITDKITSPLASHADVALLSDITSPTFLNSYLGIFFLIEAISFELSGYRGIYTQGRLERLNGYLSELELY